MEKIDPTVKKETIYIAVFELIFSMLMQAVFLIIGKWNYTVLLGNLLGAFAAVLNFFLMGLGVQKSVNLEQKEASDRIKLSQRLRLLMLVVFAAVGVCLKCFSSVAAIIPLLFPRISIALRPLLIKISNPF